MAQLETGNSALTSQCESLKEERDRVLEVSQDLRLQINQQDKKNSAPFGSVTSSLTKGISYDVMNDPGTAEMTRLRDEVGLLKTFMNQFNQMR